MYRPRTLDYTASHAGYLGGLFGVSRLNDPLLNRFSTDFTQRACYQYGFLAGRIERKYRIRTGAWVWLKGCWTYPAPTRAEDNPLWETVQHYRDQQDLAA